MMGCLRRVGCLVVLVVAGIGAWLARDLWWERVTGTPARAHIEWSGPTRDSAAMADRLARSRNAAWVSLDPGELATMLEAASGRVLLEPQVAIAGDAIHVRGRLALSEVPTAGVLGPFAKLLSGEPRIEFAGRPSMAGRGTARIRVTDLRVAGVEVPGAARAALIRQLQSRGAEATDAGEGEGEIRFSVPAWLGDLRVANGKLTVYKDRP